MTPVFDPHESEFAVSDPREAALGQANTLAQSGPLTVVNALQNGLAAITYALVYVGDMVRPRCPDCGYTGLECPRCWER